MIELVVAQAESSGDGGSVAGLIGIAALVAFFLFAASRRRRRKVHQAEDFSELATRIGLRYEAAGADEEPAFRGDHQGTPVVAREVTRSTGQHQSYAVDRAVQVSTPAPSGSQTLSLGKGQGLARLGGYTTGNRSFDRHFKVNADDDAFAAAVLHDELVAWLDANARDLTFVIKDGSIICRRSGRLTEERLRSALDGLVGFARAIPDRAWVVGSI